MNATELNVARAMAGVEQLVLRLCNGGKLLAAWSTSMLKITTASAAAARTCVLPRRASDQPRPMDGCTSHEV